MLWRLESKQQQEFCGTGPSVAQQSEELVQKLAGFGPAILPRLKPGQQRLALLQPLLRSRNSRDRFPAVEVIGELAPEVPEAVPVLIGALRDPDYTVRDRAVSAVARWKEQARAAVKPLEALTGAPQPPMQVQAIEALMAIDEAAARRFIPMLRGHVAHPPKDYRLQGDASALLARIGGREDAGLIAGTLENERDSVTRSMLLESLGQLGQPHPKAISVLVGFLQRSYGADEAEKAGIALGKMGPDAVPPLLALLAAKDDAKWEGVPAAIRALGGQVSEMPEKIIPPILARLERDRYHSLKNAAAETLKRAGPRALPLIDQWAAQGRDQGEYAQQLKEQMGLPLQQ